MLSSLRRTTWCILDLTTECVCCSRRLSPAPTHVDKTPSPWCRHDLWRTGVETGVEMWMSCSESSHSIKTSYKVRRRSRDEAEWRRARLYISTEQRDWVQPLRRVTSVTWRLVTTYQTLAIEEVTPNTVVMSDRTEVEGRWLGRDVHTPFRGPWSHPRPGAGRGWSDGQVWILG